MIISRRTFVYLMLWIHFLICIIGTQRSCDFIALVTSHIPPKHKQLIRRYGLYSSRSRGKWEEQEHIVRLAPVGWKEKKELEAVSEEVSLENTESSAITKKQRSTWARLIKKVYGTDPLMCPNPYFL